MKRLLLPAIAAACVLLPLEAANAQSLLGLDFSKSNYAQGSLGAAFDSNTHARGLAGPLAKGDSGSAGAGFFASGLVGHQMAGGLALELEALYAGNDVQSQPLFSAGRGSVDTYGGLVNLKYAPWSLNGVGRVFTPYVAAGVGYGGVSYNQGAFNGRDDGLIWQAKAGVDVPLSRRLSLDLGYRYLNGPQFEPGSTGTPFDAANLSTHQHIASVGLRWAF